MPPQGVLLGIVAVVLLIACNVTNLLLVQGVERRRQAAVRLAIGASIGNLVRQRLIESLLLSLGGAVLGLPVAWQTMRFALAFSPPGTVVLVQPLLDVRVLPALAVARLPVSEVLKEQAGGGSLTGRHRIGPILVAGQIALCVALLSAGAVLVTGIGEIRRAPLVSTPTGSPSSTSTPAAAAIRSPGRLSFTTGSQPASRRYRAYAASHGRAIRCSAVSIGNSLLRLPAVRAKAGGRSPTWSARRSSR
jgi:hypothetical protein